MVRCICLLVLVLCGSAFAQAPLKALPPAVVADAPAEPKPDTEQLGRLFRGLLLKNVPEPLVEAPHGWGLQNEVTTGLRFRRTGGIRFRTEAKREFANDGHWQRLTVTAVKPVDTLTIKLNSAKFDAGKTAFDISIGLDVNLKYEQQLWMMGRRVYAGETRAKCHMDLNLSAELTDTLEFKARAMLPDIHVKANVTKADLSYRDLEVQHTLGFNGDAAKALGKAIHTIIKTMKPNLERELLEKANAAIVKAADNREVRIELDGFLKAKPK